MTLKNSTTNTHTHTHTEGEVERERERERERGKKIKKIYNWTESAENSKLIETFETK